MAPSSLIQKAEGLNFDIDTYTNPYTPPSPLSRFPTWISRFLGYRREKKPDIGNVLGAVWSCVGTFCGLAVVAAVFNTSEWIQRHHPPALIASFGASAILEYNAIRSPLSQPRNMFFGHILSALVGVSITKLFLLHPGFEHLKWLAGAISCGAASALMLLTGTVHPPGGASAVLAATSPEITDMGWWFVVLVAWGTTLMLMVGLAMNNVQRQFPMYWWTPVDLRQLQRARKDSDLETGEKRSNSSGLGNGSKEEEEQEEEQEVKEEKEQEEERNEMISISASGIRIPEDVTLSAEEESVLRELRGRLRKMGEDEEVEGCNVERASSSRCSTMVQSRNGSRRSETGIPPS
ncbi:HPP-domain-containing protein [Pleomassaria siparia CBS 279.74]|uniref:HPP-domain-containing protein n=1 Tax=Pleomassaria siparia CBS 279.74 TaxID=1314801 RepID=A0A6G1KQ53_9PLEO|nr:HPP-domain-containing protein [Pleomassaria siparia CBS 279.74]